MAGKAAIKTPTETKIILNRPKTMCEVNPQMQLTPIQVESYAGHKADETPRRFLIGGQWMEVVEVIDRWYQIESQPEWPRANYFKVRATDGRDYLLKHDQETDEWFLGRSW
jgi:hypothetical protein